MNDLVTESLELVAEREGDISPAIYERYFAKCPGSEALMSHIDELVRAKMMAEVYRLVMLPDYSDEEGYLNFEISNHALAYSVEPHMYSNLLYALMDTVAETLKEAWTPELKDAWESRLESLLQEIEQRASAHASV